MCDGVDRLWGQDQLLPDSISGYPANFMHTPLPIRNLLDSVDAPVDDDVVDYRVREKCYHGGIFVRPGNEHYEWNLENGSKKNCYPKPWMPSRIPPNPDCPHHYPSTGPYA